MLWYRAVPPCRFRTAQRPDRRRGRRRHGSARLVGRQHVAPLAMSGLGLDRLAERRLGTLSAGERVRASLATALAAAPALLCLDEPNGALDEEGLRLLLGVLDDLRAAGCTIMVASHQPAGLLPFADAHLELVDGQLGAR
jgi:ABC-type Mn2+/Zn2+ transport system ATPase subunit